MMRFCFGDSAESCFFLSDPGTAGASLQAGWCYGVQTASAPAEHIVVSYGDAWAQEAVAPSGGIIVLGPDPPRTDRRERGPALANEEGQGSEALLVMAAAVQGQSLGDIDEVQKPRDVDVTTYHGPPPSGDGELRAMAEESHCQPWFLDGQEERQVERQAEARLRQSLQEETWACLMGQRADQPAAPERFPTLLGRCPYIRSEPRPDSELVQKAQYREAQAKKHQALRAFLVKAGFREVNGKKKSAMGLLSRSFCYPLHTAVEANDPAAVEILLWAGGDRSLVDSNNVTPLALAEKLDRERSHQEIIEMLSI